MLAAVELKEGFTYANLLAVGSILGGFSMLRKANQLSEQIGDTDLLRIDSLSRLSGCDIFVKCEYQNPGGSIKDRAALQMVQDAMAAGTLQPGMTIVEGTAGNTGIGLALVAKSLGLQALIVMPEGQTPEKQRMVELFGASLKLVAPCPFRDPKHFYHTARRIAEEQPKSYWWANQFENLSNFKAHYEHTAREIWQQCDQKLDALVSVAGTGGTIGGCSARLKELDPNIEVYLVDPDGSGLKSYVEKGVFEANGSSFTEGIGIMRLVANFAQAKVDRAYSLPDQDIVAISRYVRDQDGLILGSSSALNLAGSLLQALKMGPGKRLVTFACDLGERSYSKLYDDEYLRSRGLVTGHPTIEQLCERYHKTS